LAKLVELEMSVATSTVVPVVVSPVTSLDPSALLSEPVAVSVDVDVEVFKPFSYSVVAPVFSLPLSVVVLESLAVSRLVPVSPPIPDDPSAPVPESPSVEPSPVIAYDTFQTVSAKFPKITLPISIDVLVPLPLSEIVSPEPDTSVDPLAAASFTASDVVSVLDSVSVPESVMTNVPATSLPVVTCVVVSCS
jgi:hypothetical protein